MIVVMVGKGVNSKSKSGKELLALVVQHGFDFEKRGVIVYFLSEPYGTSIKNPTAMTSSPIKTPAAWIGPK